MPLSESSIQDRRNQIVIFALIVLAAVFVRVYWAAGFIPKDDAEFAKVAFEMSQGIFEYDRYEGPPVIPVRTGIVLPTAASMTLFGIGEAQLALYPLVMSVALISLIYLFAAGMFNHQAARIAAIIWIFLPMEIEIATMLWPEVPATALAFIGIYCVYIARSREGVGQRAQLLYGVAGGLAFGASWLCKASIVYFVPFCLALIVFDFHRSRFQHFALWSGVAGGSLAILVAEMLTYGIITGDWLYRFTAIHRNYELLPEFFFVEGARLGYEVGTPFWKAVIKRIAIDGPSIILLNPHFLFLPVFGAIAALFGLYRRDNRFYFMSALFVVLIVMFNGFSASLQTYQPLPLYNRYFYPICVPAVILTGGMLATLIRTTTIGSVLRERPESFFWGAILILILATQIAWSTFRHARDRTETWSQAEKYLAGVLSPEDRIHTDALSRNALEFFWRYPSEMNVAVYGEPGLDFAVGCDGYVLRNHSYNQWLTTNYGMWLNMNGFELPEIVRDPPGNWRIRWTNQNATLFEVSCAE